MTNKELEKEVKRQKVLIDCSAKLIQLQKNHIAELEKLLAKQYKAITSFRGLQDETLDSLSSFHNLEITITQEYKKLSKN
ncbi:MAG: hypothetical protein ACPGUI_06525 [Halarcobacter sp.]